MMLRTDKLCFDCLQPEPNLGRPVPPEQESLLGASFTLNNVNMIK